MFLFATNWRASNFYRDRRIILIFIFSFFLAILALLSLRHLPRHFSNHQISPPHISSNDYYEPPNEFKTSDSGHLNTSATWTFDPIKDAENYGLSEAECSSAFPKLYDSIEDMVGRHETNPIKTISNVRDPAVRGTVTAMVYQGELYVIDDSGMTDYYGTRLFATLESLHRALVSFPHRAQLPNCEFIICWNDQPSPGAGVWGYTKKDEPKFADTWLMPDFGFFSWPEPKTGAYTEVRRAIRRLEMDQPFEKKVPKLVWRGARLVEDRNKLLKQSEGKPWADVQSINWQDKEDLKKHRLSMPDHCRYMFVAHVSGFSWSGQGKYVRNCHSVFVSHTLEWREIYDSALVYSGPEQNAVRVADDWSDLEVTMKALLANTTMAKTIADNARDVLRDRYLTPAAEACYWRRLIQGYASVSFDPKLYEADGKTLRGVPYESFTLLRKVHWDAY